MSTQRDSTKAFFSGRTQMHAYCRDLDWSKTSLGSVEGWPASLLTAVRLCLDSPTPMSVWGGSDLVLIYNDGYAATLGPDRHPWALGRPGREVWGQFWDWLGPELEQVTRRGEPTYHEDQRVVVSHAGRDEEALFTYSHTPIREADGSIVGSLNVVETSTLRALRDRSARRDAEEALRTSEERYRTLFESIDEGFCIIEVLFDGERPIDYCFLEVNPAFARHTGLENATGKRVREMVPGHDEHWFETYGRVARTGEPARFENAARALGRFYDVYAFRVGEPEQRQVAVLFNDISERKRAEQALRVSEKRQAFLLQLSDGLRSLSDAKEIKATAARTLGERLGADRVMYAEHVRKDDDDHWLIENVFHRPGFPFPEGVVPLRRFGSDAYDLLRGRTVVRHDVFGDPDVAPDAKKTLRSASIAAYVAMPLKKSDRPAAVLAVHQSTPRVWQPDELALIEETAERTWAAVERARAEEALREANDRLLEADRRKDEFLAVLSHELRNPLSPILNSIYILERAAPGGELATRARQVIDRQARHMARLIDDLLDVTRISRGKITLQRETVDLAAIARGTAEDHREMFARNGVELEVVEAGKPLWVDGDRTRLAQVIANLLTNAAKFTPRGGKTVLVVEASTHHQAVVRVRDDGAGMSLETLEHLFEPFVQASQTIERSHGGLGLGLALVKGLVEMHDGTVTAHSGGEGKGSELVVTLPLQSSTTPTLEARTDTAPRTKTRRVLVIEDNEDAAETLREALELGGHEVMVAYSGPEGLETARAERPDVILCDLGLPGLDGYEVARSIREDSEPEVRQSFLVALSGYALPEDITRSREAGFARHIAKPPSIDTLEALLEEASVRSDAADEHRA